MLKPACATFLLTHFTNSATTPFSPLSLHDALPISNVAERTELGQTAQRYMDAGEYVPDEVTNAMVADRLAQEDRKSTRLNSSHVAISYAVFCLKNNNNIHYR